MRDPRHPNRILSKPKTKVDHYICNFDNFIKSTIPNVYACEFSRPTLEDEPSFECIWITKHEYGHYYQLGINTYGDSTVAIMKDVAAALMIGNWKDLGTSYDEYED